MLRSNETLWKGGMSYCLREYTLVNCIYYRLCLLIMVLPVDWLVEDPWDFIDVTFFNNKVKKFVDFDHLCNTLSVIVTKNMPCHHMHCKSSMIRLTMLCIN
jgi:hypothetical protein